MQSGSAEFRNAREAMASPLAKRLFGIDGVTGAFFGSDFVTVRAVALMRANIEFSRVCMVKGSNA